MSMSLDATELTAPLSAELYLTGHCNLDCSFCYYKAYGGGDRREDLPTESWKRVIDELAELRVFRINIPGGEPFMRSDLFELLRHIVDRRMRFHLNTNGTLLAERDAEELGGMPQLDGVQLSLDGMAEDHEAIRGAGTWNKTVEAIRLLKKHGVNVSVNTVLTSGTWERCAELGRFVCGELRVDRWRIVPVNDAFAPLAQGFDCISDVQTAHVISRLLPLAEKYPALANGGSPFLRFYNNIRHPNPERSTPCRCCGLLWRGITIRSDGAIVCCPNGGDKVLGWVGRDRIGELWKNAPLMNELRRRAREGRRDMPEKCAGCEYLWYCRQSCPGSPREGRRHCLKAIRAELERCG